MAGILLINEGPSHSNVAAKIGNAAFLEPPTATRPRSGPPGRTINLSIITPRGKKAAFSFFAFAAKNSGLLAVYAQARKWVLFAFEAIANKKAGFSSPALFVYLVQDFCL
jgi:hypothetical protein